MNAMFQTFQAIIEISRPKQWVKNAFLFAPLIFAKEFANPVACMRVGTAFLMFCLVSSCVYMMNDIADIERDRQHPKKKQRPLPSGRLRIPTVVVALLVLLFGSLLVSFWLAWELLVIVCIYFAINVLYSFYWRSIVILDGMIIAAGFVLRIYAGAVVIHCHFSDWLYICAIFVSLFLAYSKRRHEILLLGDDVAKSHRAILQEYSIQLLDQIITIVTASTIVSYSVYCIDENNKFYSEWMKFTIPFVIYGLFRYLYLVYRREEGGNPTELLLNDRPVIVNGVLWLLVVFWALFHPHEADAFIQSVK